MPQRFKESGYWTGAVGKVFHNEKFDHGDVAWDLVLRFENDEMPMVAPLRETFEAEHGPITEGKSRRKWREFYPTIAPQTRGQQPGYGPTGLTDEQHKDGKNSLQICEWLTESAHGDKPFFMACGIHKPHGPFLAPDRYFEIYPKASLEFTPASLEFWKTVPKIAQTKRYEGFGFEFGVENDDLRREYHYTKWPTGEELYDLSLDPYEETNLANSSKHNATLEMMRKHLARLEMSAIAARQRSEARQVLRSQ